MKRTATLVAALLLASCASTRLPPPQVLEHAKAVAAYSARLRVSLHGPELRARTAVLLAFQRPDALRLELPGPTGVRLLAVARAGQLIAVFPGERAVYSGPATAEAMRGLLGLALEPAEVMDLLTGTPSPRLRSYAVVWGEALPRKLDVTLPDGARLKLTVEDPRIESALPPLAFAEPPHPGFREVDAEQARELWGGR